MKKLMALMGLLVIMGCGVKGDPIPPKPAIEPGRGKPTFRRAIEKAGVIEDRDMREDDEDVEEER